MKNIMKVIVMLVGAALALAACSNAFFMGAIDLAGKTLIYYSNVLWTDPSSPKTANGHDTITLRFDATGKAGEFEIAYYTLDFATQAAEDSASYTQMSWFQNDGKSGTFTYDPATSALAMTMTQGYSPALGAATLTSGTRYASASCASRSLADYQSFKQGVAVTAASETLSGTVQVTADNLYAVCPASSAADTWVGTLQVVNASTVAGTTTTVQQDQSMTYGVSDGTLSVEAVLVTTSSAAPPKQTVRQYENLSVLKCFIAGQADSPTATFAGVWTKGNDVTFQCNNVSTYVTMYQGDTQPTIPTTMDADGTKTDVGATWITQVDDNPTARVVNLTHGGSYIYSTSLAADAGRSLAR